MDKDSDIVRFEAALWSLVTRFGNRRAMARIAERTGLNLPSGSWALLDYLHMLGPMRVSDIAALHGVEISTVTPRLNALEEAGLIQRHRDPADGRVSVIVIGEAGRTAVAGIHRARSDLMAQALSPDDTALLGALVPVVERMSEYLNNNFAPDRETPDKEKSHP